MPPKQSTSTAAPRGRPAGTKTKATSSTSRADKSKTASSSSSSKTAKGKGKQREESDASDAMEVEEEPEEEVAAVDDDDDDDDEPAKTIPPDLLSRILHEFFEKDGTRITKPANNAVAKYMDVFVKEAIARAAAERGGGFLEVEDLEKIAPQLLLDL